MMRGLLIAIALSILGASAVTGERIDWRRGPDLPGQRDHLGYGIVGGAFIVAGGAYWKNETKRFSAEAIAYSPRSRKWTRLPSLSHASAYGASAVYRDELVIAGGLDNMGTLTQCIRLTKKQATARWDRLPDLPHRVAGAQGAVVGSKFLVIGGAPGFDDAGLKSAYRSVLELDLLHPTKWNERARPEEYSPRIGATSAVIGGRVYLFGGYGVQADGTIGNFGDAWLVHDGVWKQLRDLPVKVRWATAVALDSRYIGIFGGYGKDFLADVYLYDTTKNVYVKSTRLPSPVCNAAVGVIGSMVYLAGGEDQKRHRSAALVIGKTVR
jgi:N-acetylneuraminic acid mutarotase